MKVRNAAESRSLLRAIALALALWVTVGACASGPAAGNRELAPAPVAGNPTAAGAVASEPLLSEATATESSTGIVASPSDSIAASAEPEPGDQPESDTPVVATHLPASTPAAALAQPSSTSTATVQRQRVIALDPGHGGPEAGASAPGLAEKNVNLEIALKVADLLRAQDFEVVLTRDGDRAVSPDFTGGGYPGVSRDLQARIDIANSAGADLFFSIHNNGSADSWQSGTEVWYDPNRSFGDRNRTLAVLLKDSVLQELAAIGYRSLDRGIKDDTNFRIFQGRPFNIYVLGPGNGPRAHVPTQMPGVLGETLFISNPADASWLRRESTVDAIAAGYRDAVVQYFEQYPEP